MLLQMKADQVETQARICALEETLIHAISIIKQSDAAELETYLTSESDSGTMPFSARSRTRT